MACTVSIFKPQDNRMISTPSPSIIPFMPAMVLPEPTYTLPDPNKKPHTRKQRIGHVPRPRNAFILFRCDFVRQKKIPAQVEKDHRNISRIVGQIWRQMNDKQRKPWVSMADEEKIAHSKLYPTYRFATSGSTKKSKRGDDIPHETQKPENQQCWNDSDFLDIHRSSSCPPGNLHVPHSSLESYNGYGAPLKTRDDMGRRPSRVTFYQSHQLPSPPITEAGERRGTFHNDMANEEDPETRFCGPRINFYPYSSNGPQEWDVPTQPYTWTDWSALQSDPLSSSGGSLETDANNPFFIDPFLSNLSLSHFSDSHDTFSSINYALQPSLETEAPFIYPPLERQKLPDTPPDYIQSIGKYHSDLNDPLFWNSDSSYQSNYHHDSSEQHDELLFSSIPTSFPRALGKEWDNSNPLAAGVEFNVYH